MDKKYYPTSAGCDSVKIGSKNKFIKDVKILFPIELFGSKLFSTSFLFENILPDSFLKGVPKDPKVCRNTGISVTVS